MTQARRVRVALSLHAYKRVKTATPWTSFTHDIFSYSFLCSKHYHLVGGSIAIFETTTMSVCRACLNTPTMRVY